MTYVVYILQSLLDGKYYIGSTSDLAKRLKSHNSGLQRSTKNRRPFKLVYTEKYDTEKSARARERQIKAYKGGNAFKKLIGP